jgi:hypothetical protein
MIVAMAKISRSRVHQAQSNDMERYAKRTVMMSLIHVCKTMHGGGIAMNEHDGLPEYETKRIKEK